MLIKILQTSFCYISLDNLSLICYLFICLEYKLSTFNWSSLVNLLLEFIYLGGRSNDYWTLTNCFKSFYNDNENKYHCQLVEIIVDIINSSHKNKSTCIIR